MPDDFGSQLRRARMRKGLDVNTVARRLRIRPDIIQAIEESDFDRMPPRGYARNMINSYAQLLGLNASEVTRQYLDEQYAFQVNAARKNSRGTGFDMPNSSRTAAARAEAARMRQAQSRHYEVSGYERGDLSQPRNARPRDRYSDSERPGRRMYDDYDSGRIMARSEAERTYRNGGHRSKRSVLGEEPVFNAVASPAPQRGLFGGRFSNVNWPLFGIIAAAAILVIVLLVLVFGPKGGSSQDVSNLSVSSETESTATSDAAGAAATAPTAFTFSYTVNSGSKTWIEVYIDGQKQVAENVEGPVTKTFTTSGVLEFICADPSGVKATQDGKDIPLTVNESGVVSIKIAFNDVLAQWQAEHGLASSSSAAGSSSASSSSAAASSSSSQSLRGIDNEARQAANDAEKEKKASEEEGEESEEDADGGDGESEEEYADDEGYSEEEYTDESEE